MNLSVLVCSADANSDLWPIFFEAWFLNSPFKDFKIYLSSETLQFNDSRVITLTNFKGGISNWSVRLMESLDFISSDYVLLLTDDLIFLKDLHSNSLDKIDEYITSRPIDMLRLVPRPPPPRKKLSKELFNKLPSWALYRVSLQASIWRNEVLSKIVIPNETPWMFEVEGTKRSVGYENFYGTNSDLVRYVEIISAGKITKQGRTAVGSLNSSHLLMRNKTSFIGEIYRKYSFFKSKIYYQLPMTFQKILIKCKIIGRNFQK